MQPWFYNNIILKKGIIPLIFVIVLIFLAIHTLQLYTVDSITIQLLIILCSIPVLKYITKIKIGDNEIEFNQGVHDLVEQVSSDNQLPQTNSSLTDYDEIFRDPLMEMIKLRRNLEIKLREIAKMSNIEGSRIRGINQILSALLNLKVIDPYIVGLIRDILPLANKAAHGGEIGFDESVQLINLGDIVIEMLDKKLNNLNSRRSQ